MKKEKNAKKIAQTGKATTISMVERITYRFNDFAFVHEQMSTTNEMVGTSQMVIGPPSQHDTRYMNELDQSGSQRNQI